jgi:hypothetical protein
MANLDGETLLDFLIGDFETMWNAVAALPGARYRGNFMFALQAVALLEVASRAADPRGLTALTSALRDRDRRYFTKLPGRAPRPRGVKLPGAGTDTDHQLLHALFDLVRNGPAHQYQPTVATLSDGQHLHFVLTGADYGLDLESVARTERPNDVHLKADIDSNRDVWVKVRTDVLFIDVRDAVRTAELPSREFRHLEAPTDRKEFYTYSSEELIEALQRGDHFRCAPTLTPQGYLPTSPQLVPTGPAGPIHLIQSPKKPGDQ